MLRAFLLVLALPFAAQAQPAAPAAAPEARPAPRLRVLVIVESESRRVRPAVLREAIAAADVLAFGLQDPRASAADATVTVVVAESGQSARVLFVPEGGPRTVRQLSATGEVDAEGRWMADAIAQLVRAYEARLRGERGLVLTDLVDPWYVIDPAEVRVERVPQSEVIDPWRGVPTRREPRLATRVAVTTELLDPWRESTRPPPEAAPPRRVPEMIDPWRAEAGRDLAAPRPAR